MSDYKREQRRLALEQKKQKLQEIKEKNRITTDPFIQIILLMILLQKIFQNLQILIISILKKFLMILKIVVI